MPNWRGILATLALTAGLARGAEPLTKAQLLGMAHEKVDPKVMLALVERDCLDFQIDAANVLELSREVPPEVLEAAIRCRGNAEAATRDTDTPKAVPASGSPAGASPPAAPAPPPAGTGELRIRAEFIGEAAALSCECQLDGKPFAVLTKPEQGAFGEAVPRDRIQKQTDVLPVGAGRHVLRFRCDPHGQVLSQEIEIAPGDRKTVDIGETMFRRWKVRGVTTK